MPRSEPPSTDERALVERVDAAWNVDSEHEDTFLFASIANVGELGIFLRTNDPLPVGTTVLLRFDAPGMAPFSLRGRVRWINQLSIFGDNINPGMGIIFLDLAREDRERVVAAIRTIVYLRGDVQKRNAN